MYVDPDDPFDDTPENDPRPMARVWGYVRQKDTPWSRFAREELRMLSERLAAAELLRKPTEVVEMPSRADTFGKIPTSSE
jgi:hypothetical protein